MLVKVKNNHRKDTTMLQKLIGKLLIPKEKSLDMEVLTDMSRICDIFYA